MSTVPRWLKTLVPLVLTVAIVRAETPPALRQVATIPLPAVTGRIDHLAFDRATGRLFVAGLGNGTVEVLETATNTFLRSLPGFLEPQGIAVAADAKIVAVANGGSGKLRFLDAGTLEPRGELHVGADADNVRYDSTAKAFLVAIDGGIVSVDPASARIVDRINMGGHPESFQLAATGKRLFANVPDTGQVVVADRTQVTGRWPMTACHAHYPMALDEPTGRLFVGCRHRAMVAALDTTTGKTVALTETVGDTDDLFYDRVRHLLYVIGGEGFVDVIRRDGDDLHRIDRIEIRAGARTGLWVAEQNRLYVAVPAREGQPAEIRVFEAPGPRKR